MRGPGGGGGEQGVGKGACAGRGLRLALWVRSKRERGGQRHGGGEGRTLERDGPRSAAGTGAFLQGRGDRPK